jgi:hypothetical protein
MDQLNNIYRTLDSIDLQLRRTLDQLRHALIQADQEIQDLRKEVEELRSVRK